MGGWCKWERTGSTTNSFHPHDTHTFTTGHGGAHIGMQFTKTAIGHWKPHVTQDCVNNQNCGLHDAQTCHDCDTEQECKDMGMSSTLFVTHHRKYMQMNKKVNWETKKHDRAQYHCRRVGPWGQHSCKCAAGAACLRAASEREVSHNRVRAEPRWPEHADMGGRARVSLAGYRPEARAALDRTTLPSQPAVRRCLRGDA